MVASVLAYFERYGGREVLLFHGEEVVIQRLTDEVVFRSEWEEWFTIPEMAPLLAGHVVESLPQPFL